MRVKSITFAGVADVYNMEVEETHSFAVQRGIIVHNCYDSDRYACMSRPMTPMRKQVEKSRIAKHKERLSKSSKQSRQRIT